MWAYAVRCFNCNRSVVAVCFVAIYYVVALGIIGCILLLLVIILCICYGLVKYSPTLSSTCFNTPLVYEP